MPRRRGSGAQGRRGKGKWSMDYTLVKQVRDNAPLRESFFALARRVFGLSFEEWHRAGWWTDRYVPYTMVYRDGSAAANVSANRIDAMEFLRFGERKRYVQLGTVMTAPAHRGKGLARSLMEAVLDDWGRTCDGVYLYANGTVLEFYPKFGFVPAREHVCTLPLPAQVTAPAEGGFARLDMDTQAGRALLLRCREQNAIPIINYNDPVSDEEVRKMELASRRAEGVEGVECVDNDETAEVVAQLVGARNLILLTSTNGIYLDRNDPDTLVELVSGRDIAEVRARVTELMGHCSGASRTGANGARAKLAFAMRAVEHGTNVIIGHARYHITDLLAGRVPCTRLGVNVEKQA